MSSKLTLQISKTPLERTKIAMVSIRRRKLLGQNYVGKNSFLTQVPRAFEHGQANKNGLENKNLVNVHPLSSNDRKEETTSETGAGSSNVSAPSPLNEHLSRLFPEIKRRKRHRRKHVENQEPCTMRGVYFKNMKWQAAIKVDKKQIHLGTVASQEEAARLYDRAAFMCGREPNFELPKDEKQELKKYKWNEFLAITRSAISNKKSQPSSRRRIDGSGKKHNNDWEGEQESYGFSASEDDHTLVP